jgi:glucose/arabinose dehydrogenase
MKVLVCALIGLSAYISSIPDTAAFRDPTIGGKLATTAIALDPVVTTGLTQPILVTNARDGSNRLFIVEQAGPIKVLQPGSTSPTMFLDLTFKVWSGGERGMLGLAFHPQFATNRRFFVTYTLWPDGTLVLGEYRVSASNPNVADATETVIFAIPHPAPIHNGGGIIFGADNYLYIGLGDGGALPEPNHPSQNKEQLVGKILRIDIDTPNPPALYSSPPSNPFFGSTPGRDEIYAMGLRNPWRFSFDRVTGQLYVADVGQALKEEVNLVTLGGNYGWAVFEGTLCSGSEPELCIPANYTPPILEYAHSSGGCAIIGGHVYRGTKSTLPTGSYIFGDHCSGEIALLEGSTPSIAADTMFLISSFGEDESGEIYVATYESSGIYRVVKQQYSSALKIQMSTTTYFNGQPALAMDFRLVNPGSEAAKVELKVSLTIPGISPISFMNIGADGTFTVPPGMDQNFAPVILFTVTPLSPRGIYSFNSRMTEPVTGRLVSEDLNTFIVQ